MDHTPNRRQRRRGTAGRLGAQSLVVLGGSLFTLAVGLPLQIYVSRVLGPGDLGIYGLLEGVVSTASGFLSFGLAQTVVRFVPHHLELGEYRHIRRLLGLSSTLLLLVGFLGYGLLLISFPVLERFWPELQGHYGTLTLMGLLLPLGLLMFSLQQGLRGLQEIRYMVLGSSVLQLLVKAAITIVAFSVGLYLSGYILATVVGTCVGLLWMAHGLRQKLASFPVNAEDDQPFPLAQWRRYALLNYSTNGLLGSATGYIDRFLLAAFMGSSTVGVLLVIRQLQQLPQALINMLLMVGAPMFAAAHARNDPDEREHLYVLMTDWVMKASLPLLIFLFLLGEPVLLLFGLKFAELGSGVLWIFLLGQAISLACGPVGSLAMMSGLEATVLRLSAINMLLTASLLVILAPTLGLLGVGIASAVSMSFINIAIMVVLRRRLGIRWWHRRFLDWLLPSCASVASGVGALYAGFGAGALGLATSLLVMYATFAVVLLLQGINEDERDLIRHLKDRLLRRPVVPVVRKAS